jgi:acyl-CoA synthetase (AMP-forming)/AMP-acid ligase II
LIIHFGGKTRRPVVVICKWEVVSVVNVSYIIQQHVTENPDKTAIIFGERRISYLALDRLINRFAGGLLNLGLKRGEVLSLFLPSLPELIIGYLGAVRAGITVNVVNAMLREQEVVYIMKDCVTRAILVDDKRLPIIESIYSQVESLRKVIVLENSKMGDYTAFDSVLNQGDDRFEPVRTRESDLCHLMYTSGTTGFPKGVMATHRNIRHNATKFGGVHFKPENLIRQVEERLKWRYAEAWGLTEVSCVGTTAHYTQTRIGSCGRGMDDAEIKVVDDFGNTLPPGQQGELCIKGTCVTNGYLKKAEATRNAFDAEGWFHSGDVAHMDEDGYAYIVDRKKDMINVGGEKVFPSEVEDMMLTHSEIKDLVVVGIPDDLKGEAPKAFIQLKEGDTATEQEIKEFCKLKMAPYKVPVAVEFVEEIPRSASGKALRRMLRDKEWKK